MHSKFLIFIGLFFISLLFISCSQQEPTPNKTSKKLNASKKTFPEEDVYILFALRAEQIQDNKSASELFSVLYEKSHKINYLYRSLNNDIVAKENQKVIDLVDEKTKASISDPKLIRFKIIALIEMQKLDEAIVLSTELVKKTESIDDYILLSDIYIKQRKYDIALKYLESAYVKDYNENVLDKMSIIMYVNLHRKKDAIAQLETHSRIKGCSKLICGRLVGFYSNENNIDGTLETSLRLYNATKDEEVAKNIIQIYGYKKNYVKMISFLEKSKTDEETLLQLYIYTKNYQKAFPLSDKLYSSSGDIAFLGQSAIYEYESSRNKDDMTVLNSVVRKLETVVKEDNSPIYKNYLGYVLIDHNLDVRKGMEYIKEVLTLEPNSAFYLDSLAWGYYKLDNCKKAKAIMDKVLTLEGGDDPEVRVHINQINDCLKNKKGANEK